MKSLVAVLGTVVLATACSSNSRDAGTGGSPPTEVGTAADAGAGVAGFGGAVTGGAGGAGTAGAGGELGVLPNPLCDGMSAGALTSNDRPRPTFPWTFVAAPTIFGGGGQGGSAVTAGGGASGTGGTTGVSSACTLPGDVGGSGVTCTGMASMQYRTSGPLIVMDDGSQLAWESLDAHVPPPYVTQDQGPGDRVWIDFDQEDVVCLFCGSYRMRTLTVRDGQNGPVRFMAREGVAQKDLTPAETMDLFGVDASAQPLCSLTLIGDCNIFTRTVYAHVLGTTPPQTVPAASTTDVTTPTGTFAVFWTASTQSDSQIACIDGPRIANDTGIAITRLPPTP